MDSWWDLGEGHGFDGRKLNVSRITCPFCFEKGNFSIEHDAIKKKANHSKVLHFSTLKCENCAGYVMALWAATSSMLDLHNFQVLPWPKKVTGFPDEWPGDVGRYWVQAAKSLLDENWDAAAVMARSALQLALRKLGSEGKNLKQEIDDFGVKGLIPPAMIEWSHEVRELGNDSAHPIPNEEPTSREDATEIIRFINFLFKIIFTIPFEIEQYRGRKNTNQHES